MALSDAFSATDKTPVAAGGIALVALAIIVIMNKNLRPITAAVSASVG